MNAVVRLSPEGACIYTVRVTVTLSSRSSKWVRWDGSQQGERVQLSFIRHGMIQLDCGDTMPLSHCGSVVRAAVSQQGGRRFHLASHGLYPGFFRHASQMDCTLTLRYIFLKSDWILRKFSALCQREYRYSTVWSGFKTLRKFLLSIVWVHTDALIMGIKKEMAAAMALCFYFPSLSLSMSLGKMPHKLLAGN